MEDEKGRKIIEIYVTEEGEDEVSFNAQRCENTEIANFMMKKIIEMIYATYNNNDFEITNIEED